MALGFINLFRKNREQSTAAKTVLNKYYNIEPIDNTGAVYRMIIGQRSNGKTYSVCKHIIDNYFDKGERAAYIRRYEEDITPKNISSLFAPHIQTIIERSGGRYNAVFYRAKEFHLCYMDEDGKVTEKDPTAFCIAAAINTAEHTKGQDRGEVQTILFDEFMSRMAYLNNEFVLFMNLLSSLIRDRQNAVVYMLANSVNKYCPYFKEMGLKNVEAMKQGEIAIYEYSNSDLTVAVEYCDKVEATQKTASKYFAFENSQLKMITSGEWEFQIYPRPENSITEDSIKYRFWILFGEQCLCGEIVNDSSKLFIFLHPQTKDIKFGPKDVVYTTEFTQERLHVRFLKDTPTELHKLIKDLIVKKAVCFSDNECGEVFRNWCQETQNLKLY